MKLKAAPHSRVVVELEPGESRLPSIVLPEFKLSKILVPVDFSESSRKAYHYGLSFARQFRAQILLCHVVETVPPPPNYLMEDTVTLTSQLEEAAVKQLSEWNQEASGTTTVKTSVQHGTPYREIVQLAHEQEVDLIVIGMRGRSGLARFFLGSTAERVVRYAPCPTLVVRERTHDFLEQLEDHW